MQPLQSMKSACWKRMPHVLGVARKSQCLQKTSFHSGRSVVTNAADQKRLYVVDMMPYVYRTILSTGYREATTAGQQQQQQQQLHAAPLKNQYATQQFMEMLLGLIRRKQSPPTHMALVVDVPGPNFRQLKYPQYKAHRLEQPPQLMVEVSRMLALVDAVGIPILAVPGVEADDVVGSLAVRAAGDGFDVVLVSTDKDFDQLLRPGISILRYPTATAPYTAHDFAQEHGLPIDAAHLWTDVKALAGDPSDNIPGVKSVGSKTALQLVKEFGSLERILESFAAGEQPEQVKLNKTQAEILRSPEGAAAARFAKQLVTIVTDLKSPPVRQPWSMFELKLPPTGGSLAMQRAEVLLGQGWTSARLRDLFLDWEIMAGSHQQ